MLGALALKWQWRKRREAAGKPTDRPNLVFGGDVHVVWEKFCRYFDVEPRIVPLQEDKYTIGPEDVEPHVDENTIGVAAVLGTTFTGHADDIPGINDFLVGLKNDKGLDVPLHVDGASGGVRVAVPLPALGVGLPARAGALDQRLRPQVRARLSRGSAGSSSGRRSDLPDELVFEENYLGKTDATFTLNFSTGSAMVLAQYYNFIRFGHDGYRYIMEMMQRNAQFLGERIAASGEFELIGADEEQLPLVAFKLDGGAELRRVRRRRAARRRARLDGPRLHAAARRREREDHARAGQGDAQPRAGERRSRTTSPRPATR